jgi:hypothetical protein
MKFIISEDRIYDLVMKHINSMFDVDNIHWINGADDFGNEVDYAISFYLGDYDDDENLFRWYNEDYWRSEEVEITQSDENLKKWIEQSPILEFDNNGKKEQLDNLFGDRWHQPFKDWFQKNFDLPIKTIE